MERLGQNPAFPVAPFGNRKSIDDDGISKRFYAACAAMQGLIIHFPYERTVNNGYIALVDHTDLIKQSYQLADELLKQEKSDK